VREWISRKGDCYGLYRENKKREGAGELPPQKTGDGGGLSQRQMGRSKKMVWTIFRGVWTRETKGASALLKKRRSPREDSFNRPTSGCSRGGDSKGRPTQKKRTGGPTR